MTFETLANVVSKHTPKRSLLSQLSYHTTSCLSFFFFFQEMAAYKMAALQKALDDSVPSSDLERANKQYTELTVRYRDMLQRDSRLIQRTTHLEHLEVLKRINCIFSTLPICTYNQCY